MPITTVTRRVTAAATTGALALALSAAPASAHGPFDHHHPRITHGQRACLTEHGFGGPVDFRRPSVRRAFLAAWRECTAPDSTTTTTSSTTTPPIVVS